jgi:hypothetical protein
LRCSTRGRRRRHQWKLARKKEKIVKNRQFELIREEEERAAILARKEWQGQPVIIVENLDDLIGKIDDTPPPYRHPPFEEAEREIFRRFARTFAEVYPISLEKWEAEFRRELFPWKEILLWESVEASYAHFTEGRVLRFDQKHDIWRVIRANFRGQQARIEIVRHPPLTLSRKRVLDILGYLSEEWQRQWRDATGTELADKS